MKPPSASHPLVDHRSSQSAAPTFALDSRTSWAFVAALSLAGKLAYGQLLVVLLASLAAIALLCKYNYRLCIDRGGMVVAPGGAAPIAEEAPVSPDKSRKNTKTPKRR